MIQKSSEEALTRGELRELLQNHPYIDKNDLIVAGGLVGSRDKIPEFMEIYHHVLKWMPAEERKFYREARISTMGEILMEYAMMQERAKLAAKKS